MQTIAKIVDEHRQLILDTLDYIWENPETGYREWKTTTYMEDVFTSLGYDIVKAEGIPGLYTIIDTGRPGPELLIMGELDSLICQTHPEADPETGAVHCCGHAAQCAALVGIAAALKNPEILDRLSGRIRLCAVPAEELIEIGYRSELKAQGKIRYFGGKPEFLSRGYFDGVDLAFMVHTTSGEDFIAGNGNVGCIAKKVIYKGVSAHAGGSPWNGCNALYAANLGLSGINAIRETFKEPDIIRVHPIITQGGTAVNAIPEAVCIESYVRGSSFEGIKSANEKVNRALCGGALAIGANVDICDIPGYAPLYNDPNLIAVAAEALQEVMPGKELKQTGRIGSGSTDMGDLSCIMPVIHPHAPGAVGTSHGDNYYIDNPDLACVGSAKWQVALAVKLLENGAEKAKKIVADYKPQFASKEEYLAYLDSFDDSGDRITYHEDGTASVRLKKQ
ncbi:MAG: amidohydrolase [Ruminococcaceae bacterium]|nr:amidohydrolase [Oscillospiraceae bacterium]